jgi:small multidrug resistance pump
MAWVYLLFAISLEIAATVSLKLSQGLTNMIPSVLMVVFYLLAFFNLSLSLKQVPISVAYAIWSGIGTAAIAIIGYMYFQETMTLLKVVSLCLIILGVIGLNIGGGAHSSNQSGISP